MSDETENRQDGQDGGGVAEATAPTLSPADGAPAAGDSTETPAEQPPQPSAYDKLMQVAACVERAKFALGLKGFFDPAQTEIGGLIDEVLADVPFVDKSQPVWWREPGEATVERAARAGYEALSSSAGTAVGTWDDVPESGKAGYRAAARAIMALGK